MQLDTTPYTVEKNHLGNWCVFKDGHAFSNAQHTKAAAEAIAERFNDRLKKAMRLATPTK